MLGQMSVRPLLKYIDTNLETWMTLALRPSIKFVPHTDIRVSPKPEQEGPAESKDTLDETIPQKDASSSPKQSSDEPNFIRVEPLQPALLKSGFVLMLEGLELVNISFFSCPSLSLSVSCGRCRRPNSIEHVRPSSSRISNCTKCTRRMIVTYHADICHQYNTRLGVVLCDGCTPFDILPITLQVTCDRCSGEQSDISKFTSIQGHVKTDQHLHCTCPLCHNPMHLYWSSFVWKDINPSVSSKGKQPTQKLTITPGQPLPDLGACSHYKKSFRWYRFPCCNRVYPCDKCHDADPAAEKHEMQWANRVICGKCSKEQSVSMSECSGCREGLRGKGRETSHWEGGKGTRDQTRMSKKDSKKYTGWTKTQSGSK